MKVIIRTNKDTVWKMIWYLHALPIILVAWFTKDSTNITSIIITLILICSMVISHFIYWKRL